jgi:hypothetical protein
MVKWFIVLVARNGDRWNNTYVHFSVQKQPSATVCSPGNSPLHGQKKSRSEGSQLTCADSTPLDGNTAGAGVVTNAIAPVRPPITVAGRKKVPGTYVDPAPAGDMTDTQPPHS